MACLFLISFCELDYTLSRNIMKIIEARSDEVLRKWEGFFGEVRYYC